MTKNVASVEDYDLVRQQVLNCHPHLDDIDDIESIGSECSNGIILAGGQIHTFTPDDDDDIGNILIHPAPYNGFEIIEGAELDVVLDSVSATFTNITAASPEDCDGEEDDDKQEKKGKKNPVDC